MAGNTFGTAFRITTFGESHGVALGVTIDGCPPGLALDEGVIQRELDRRRPGAHPSAGEAADGVAKLNPAMTSRREADQCEILSGVFDGKTTGTPIAVVVRNTSQKSADYGDIASKFRPGHADFGFQAKYGIRDYRGGGRSSGRETLARVAGGAVARAWLATKGISVLAWTSEAAGIACERFDEAAIEGNQFRACDPEAAERMLARIIELKRDGDSAGGVVECRIRGVPAGLGEPVFDKLDAELAKAMLSIGAIKGIEFGAGFAAADMTGSQHNDPITPRGFLTNNAGGILGGISSGQEIIFRAVIKPASSIAKPQKTINTSGEETTIRVTGRHDPCLCPRAVPVVEAMAALVIEDHFKRQEAMRA